MKKIKVINIKTGEEVTFIGDNKHIPTDYIVGIKLECDCFIVIEGNGSELGYEPIDHTKYKIETVSE